MGRRRWREEEKARREAEKAEAAYEALLLSPVLVPAITYGIGLHFLILYVPWMAAIFQIVPLTYNDWVLVMAFSMPVIFIDEVLKFCGRVYQAKELAKRLKED